MPGRLLFLLLLVAAIGHAQPFQRELEPFAVTAGAETLSLAFSGGINTPQHQFADIDGDADLDLFLYDADLTGTFSFFRNDGSASAPRYRLDPGAFLVPPFQAWFRLVDLDTDGLLDLATDDSLSGVRTYRNAGSLQAPLFVLQAGTLLDTAGTAVNAGFGNVPAFADIDGDGLIDFFSNNGVDGSINYYRNVGTPLAPAYAFITSSFQGITVLGDQCTSPAVAAKSALHGSGALTFADIDADGALDLFHGDQFFKGLFFLENLGTPSAPHLVCTTNEYPALEPVSSFGFNQPSLVDIDADGDLDLFIGVLNDMFRHGFWFYRNDGDSLAPDFHLATKDFLPVFDAGRDAAPAPADADHDGLTDIVVGNVNGQLWLLRNTGTAGAPSFALADTLFGGVTGGSAYAPAFADLGHDGWPDLFLGRFDGKVLLYRNSLGVFAATDSIAGAQYAAPAAADLDGDGDVDLLVGRGNGRVSYYRNDGADASAFSPTLVTNFYDSIDVGDNAHPTLVFDPARGVFDLYIGNAEGAIAHYRNEGDSLTPDFRLQTSAYGPIDQLRDAAPAFVDIDADGDADLFVGTLKGGLHFYRNGFTSAVAEGGTLPASMILVESFPNPFNPETTVRFTLPAGAESEIDLAVYDVAGRRVATLASGRFLPGSHFARWNAAGVASGTYYARLVTSRGQALTKLIFLK